MNRPLMNLTVTMPKDLADALAAAPAQPVVAILFEHEDGRYAVNPDTTGDPAWHRLGPVDISALAFIPARPTSLDAYEGAREDLSIWKRRALESERDLRSEKEITSRLVGEMNAANGPAYMGEPAASQPAYGATEFGWTDYRQLEDGDKRLIALVVSLYGNDHQSSSDIEDLLGRASRGQAPAGATPDEAIDAALAAAPAQPDTQEYAEWVPVADRLPEPGLPVLLDIGTKFPIRAMWAAKGTVEAWDDDSDWAEYDEETGAYYCPEGWYEWNQHEETHWAVSAAPIAWMALPATHALRMGGKP